MSKSYKITIFGAGYVGLTTAVLFANSDLEVTLVEINKERLDLLKSGKSFFYEIGVNELLQNALKNGNLKVINTPEESLSYADVIFSCVGTPDNPDGSSNLSYVYDVAKSVVKHAKNGAVFVQKSTVPVGTGEKIEKIILKYKKDIKYVSNPEFLREGTALLDSLWFDRIVVGSSSKVANKLVVELYKTVEESRDKISKLTGITGPKDKDRKYILTNRNSAELIKVTANAFLALKISFANNIAKLADESGADVVDVMDAVGADKRIGRAFLNAGRGYGGGCFPKDVSGLIASASEHGVDMQIMTAATELNESMPGYIVNKAQELLGGNLAGKNVAVLGLSFKSGTSDARKSPGVKISNILERSSANVKVYDPHASEEAKEDLRNSIIVSSNAEEAITNSEAVFIATEWPEFLNMDLEKVQSLMNGNIFFDAVNAYNKDDVNKVGLIYTGVGRN
jgi:UDPglucose 6-dehydrogenase